MVLWQILPRRDTAANFAATNPLLANGETAIETDTRLEKQGDGVTNWNALPYRTPANPNWAQVPDYAMLAKDPAKATTGWARWINVQEQVARALGWVIVTDPQWGAVPGQDCTTAIQKALDYLDAFDPVTKTFIGTGTRGGTIYFPTPLRSGLKYLISKCLVASARINWHSNNGGGSFGGAASMLVAQPGSDFTNTNAASGETGLEEGMPWMVRLSRKNPNTPEWWHSGSFQGVGLDANGVFTGGMVGEGAGEMSVVDRVGIYNTGAQPRTVNDAVFTAGSTTVTSNTGAFDVLEDMAARLDTSAAFPTWNADVSVTDASVTAGLAVVTSPSNGFGNVQVGMEMASNNAGFRGTNYVVASSAGSVTMAFPLDAYDGNTGTGKSITFGRPRDFRIEQIIDAHTIKMTRPAPVGGTARTLTIYRGRPGMRWWGGGATGNIRSLNVVGNSGAGAEWVWGGPNYIMNIAGDNNGGALIRFHKCFQAADPFTTVLSSFKSENNNYGDTSPKQYENYGDHDPAILIDYCGMLNLEIGGGAAYAGDRGSRDMIRIQQSQVWTGGYPSLTVKGLEAANPWNVGWDNLIREVDSGKTIGHGNIYSPTYGGRFYPTVLWNKDQQAFGDSYLHAVPATGLGGNLTAEGKITSTARGVNPLTGTVPLWNYLNADGQTITQANWNQAFTDAGSQGVVQADARTSLFSQQLTVPDGKCLRGLGGGLTSATTVFKATAAAASIQINGSGGACGGFQINGDSLATLCFERLNGSQRHYSDIAVINGAQDGAHLYACQNDSYTQFNIQNCGRDNLVLDQGAGGHIFTRCESLGPGRDGIHIDRLVGNGPYPTVSNILFEKCIVENIDAVTNAPYGIRGGARNALYVNGASVIKFIACELSGNNPSGPLMDVLGNANLSWDGGFIVGNPTTHSETGIRVSDTSSVQISGRPAMENLAASFSLTSPNATVRINSDISYWGVITTETVVSGGANASQVQHGTPDYTLPWRHEINGLFSPDTVISGSWGLAVQNVPATGTAPQLMGGFGYNGSGLLDADFRWNMTLSAGTWKLDVICDKDPSRSIQTWDISFDGGTTWTSIGTLDQYGTPVSNFTSTIGTTFSVPISGKAILRLRNPTKSAPGGGYISLTAARLTRTA